MPFTVTFTPTAVGQFHGAFVVTSDATSGTNEKTLNGIGTAP